MLRLWLAVRLCISLLTFIGEEGKLLVRKRPCHQHDGCMRQDQKAIMSCVRSDVCGVAKLVEIGAKGSPNVPLTRNALQLAGHALAEKALDGSFLVVEVSGEEFVPWLICEVVEEGLQATVHDFDNYMGRIEPGDFVIKLRAWDPCTPGGRRFQQTDRCFWAFAEDLRLELETDGARDSPSLFKEVMYRRSPAFSDKVLVMGPRL